MPKPKPQPMPELIEDRAVMLAEAKTKQGMIKLLKQWYPEKLEKAKAKKSGEAK